MINPASIFKLKGLWERFSNNHPMLPKFLKAVANNNLGAGTIIEIRIVTSDEKELKTNVKLSEDDMELIGQLKELAR